MEVEYKWDLPDDETLAGMLEGIACDGAVGPVAEIRMHASYYDTADQDASNERWGLRVRSEDERSVCCLKIPVRGEDGCKTRQEFEVEASDVYDGLEKLVGCGAPRDICDFLASKPLQEVCQTDFVRQEIDVNVGGFVAKLAIDEGRLGREGRFDPIHEIEFEFVSGSPEAFHDYAQDLQRRFELEVQPLSKLARARAA